MNFDKIEREPARVLGKFRKSSTGIVSGADHPGSLGCTFYQLEGGGVGTVFIPEQIHEGHRGMLHGGLIAAVLDELMGYSNSNTWEPMVKPVVTAEMTTSFRRPIMVGQTVFGFGTVQKIDGRKRYTAAQLLDEEGNLLAAARGMFITVEQAGRTTPEDYKGQRILPIDEKDPKIL